MSTFSEIRGFISSLSDSSVPIPTSYNSKELLDKPNSVNLYISYMLDRTTQMFEYSNLPPTIPDYMLELYLQTFGYAAILEIDSTIPISTPHSTFSPGLYALYGAIGGERDLYYRPKLFIPANPRIPKTIQSTIIYSFDEIPHSSKPYSVIIRNDTQMTGLLPLFSRYAHQLTENDISIRSAQINARAQIGIATSTDRDRESALKYLDDLEAGKLGILGESSFLEGISVSNISTQSANVIIQLIELQQYLKASWFNELGLNVNFNMKREYMSEEEIAVNTDILLPLIDDMYQCRVRAVDLINNIFGTSIEVRKSSAWANKEQEDMAALAEASQSGGIELPQAIASKIQKLGGNDGQIQSTDMQSSEGQKTNNQNIENKKASISDSKPQSVSTGYSSGIASTGDGTGEISGESEDRGNETSGQNEINITIINNSDNVSVETSDTTETGSESNDIPESETSEESKEPDNK